MTTRIKIRLESWKGEALWHVRCTDHARFLALVGTLPHAHRVAVEHIAAAHLHEFAIAA